MRVATFNIRTSSGRDGANAWPLRREATVAAIEALDADVVGLQEVQPDQLSYLRARFPHHTIVGKGRDGGSRGEHCVVMVSPGPWQVEAHETRWLSDRPSKRRSVGWDARLPRIATLLRVRHEDGAVAGVANTHYDHIGARARIESSRLLVDWTEALPELRWVILGDLNAVPFSEPLAVLSEAGYRDAVPAAEGGTVHSFTAAVDRQRIDHILVGDGWYVESAEVMHVRPQGRLPSDHWPVAATLRLVSGDDSGAPAR